jgi:hypothetical protein
MQNNVEIFQEARRSILKFDELPEITEEVDKNHKG